MDTKDTILQFLIAQEIKPHLKGFRYLTSALLLTVSLQDYRIPIGKIYETLAREYVVSPQAIERCMRNAIEAAWLNKEDFKPTNAEFIASSTLDILFSQKEAI